jgi:hypothetical protein
VQCLVGFRQEACSAQFDGFIERDAEHAVRAFELVNVSPKHFGFFRWQPCAPVLFQGRAGGRETIVSWHVTLPRDRRGSIAKTDGMSKDLLMLSGTK